MNTQRLSEATEWWLRLREPGVPPQTIGEWMRWCDADPENLKAFDSIQALWSKASSAPLQPVPALELRQARRRIPAGLWAVAAGLVAIAVPGAHWLMARLADKTIPVLAERGAEAVTEVGQSREYRLPDGSHVTLGGASVLSTAFTSGRRAVHLERGEAYFEVEKDSSRPFVVETLGAAITAVGTAFNIRADGGALRVSVTEGVVDVRPAGDSTGAAPMRLPAGRQVTLSGEKATPGRPQQLSAVDPDVVIAWTTGVLKFMDEPLGSVVAAVNRYSPQTVELRDDDLAQMRYTGTVVSGRIDEWLVALPNAFPVVVVQQGSGRVRVEPREP